MRSCAAVAAVGVAMLAVLLSTPGALAGTGTEDPRGPAFTVTPSEGSDTAEDGGYFLVTGRPGRTFTQSVDLHNDDDAPLRMELAAVDATTSPVGGVSYGLPDDPPRLTGSWLTVDATVVTLAPGATTSVELSVSVPDDARSGTHLAGLSVGPPAEPAPSATVVDGRAGAQVDITTRRVLALQVEVPGEAPPQLDVAGVEPVSTPDGPHLGIALQNTGGTLLSGTTGTISVPDIALDHEFSVDTFVPGTGIVYPVAVTGELPLGQLLVTVSLAYADGRTARFEGAVDVTAEVLRAQPEASGGTPWLGGRDAATGLVLAAAAGGAGVAVVLLVLLALLLRRRSQTDRRRTRPAARPHNGVPSPSF